MASILAYLSTYTTQAFLLDLSYPVLVKLSSGTPNTDVTRVWTCLLVPPPHCPPRPHGALAAIIPAGTGKTQVHLPAITCHPIYSAQ